MPTYWLAKLTVRVVSWSEEEARDMIKSMPEGPYVEQVSIDSIIEEE